jgi:phosphatidate cytidylyltransferase
MLRQRLLVLIPLIPAAVAFIFIGGLPYTIGVALVLGTAGWEFWRMFNHGGYKPSAFLLIAGPSAFVFTRHFFGFQYSDALITLLLFAAMAIHLVNFEHGCQTSALDFGITLGGLFYLGWLGAYFISIRALPDGQWWLMMVLPSIWIIDGGAYLVGVLIGKHKLSQYASPNKSWEGYAGGIISAAIFCPLLAIMWQTKAFDITPAKGLIVGLILSLVCIFGDLGESMFKRHFNIKDVSNLIPGHGGVFDRIDSWLWAVPIGFYLIQFWK